MHNYKQSKKQVAIRWFTYGILTFAVLALSTIGILAVLGYQFNPASRSLQQTALIQFRSAPSGASVTIDGKLLSGNTSTQTNATPGSHTVKMSLSGYHDWQSTINVTGGTLLWLNYSLLIPNNLKTNQVHSLDTVSSDQTSPDKKWRLMSLADKPAVLTLADLNNPQQPLLTNDTISPEVLTKAADGATGPVKVVSWDSGSRYALLSHTYGTSTEYLRFDRQNPGTIRNISKELGIDSIGKIGFGDASGAVYYVLSGTDIRKLDLGAGTISQPLVTNVSQMYYTDGSDTIAFARTNDSNKTEVGVYRDPGGLVTTNTYVMTPSNLIVTYGGDYYGYRYMATSHDGKVYLIKSPDTRQPQVVKTIDTPNPQWLYFSPNGRMLIAQNGNGFMTYDLETDRVYNNALGTATGATKFDWLDDFHLITNAGGKMIMSDFDGTNQRELGSSTAGTGVDLSNDGQWLFSIGVNSATKPVLQQTALRV
jgi:hypothetical protein